VFAADAGEKMRQLMAASQHERQVREMMMQAQTNLCESVS
jgi:hypothetical protein